MPVHFIDTNILLRYLTRDDEQKAQRALQLLIRVENGEEKVVNISFADAYNAAYMLAEKVDHIYSWDTDFDKIEGLMRVEPA